ncbi:prepilin-type N-terminal cleavage/methylation domain-containing protein [Candidatus Sumerlaeota bacterium]|nr:prepilin-type N-terminal cleavage/methylation domain-containing protein [Candidatus Sumerlaeota bacterium]
MTPTFTIFRKRTSSRRRAFSLVEVLVAVAIFSITLLGYLMGVFYMQRQNRTISQREVAMQKAIELAELFKNSAYADTVYSTTTVPKYLRRNAGGAWYSIWKIPESSTQWLTLPVEDVNPASSADPTVLTNKLPEAAWSANISTVTVGSSPSWSFRRVTITVRWKILAREQNFQTVNVTTDISPNFTWM